MPSAWQTAFKTHPLWSHARAVRQSLKDTNSNNGGAYEDRARMSRVVGTILQHERQDSALYNKAMLDSVASLMATVVSYMSQWVADPSNSSHFINAAAQLDSVVQAMVQLPPLPWKGRAEAAELAAAEYQAASSKRLSALKASIDDLHATATKLSEQVEEIRQNAAKDVSEKVEEVGDALREENRKSWQKPIEDAHAAKASADAELVEIRQLKEEAKNVAAALAEKAVAKDYRKNARNKSVGGWAWDLIGTGIGGAALGLIGYHLLNVSEETSVALAITRLAVSLAGLGLAGLCFARARTFHNEARISKRTQIRIDTVAAFVANLDADTKQAVIEGMAERLYMRGELDPVGAEDQSFLSLDKLREGTGNAALSPQKTRPDSANGSPKRAWRRGQGLW